jgi:hypothetical protein
MKESRWQRFVSFLKWLPEAPRVILAGIIGFFALAITARRRQKEEAARERRTR